MATNPHQFQFDLDLAIRSQLIVHLEASPLLALVKNVGPPESGVYALYWKTALVYVGKATKLMTKSARDLKTRLNEHVVKIGGRQGIAIADLTCRYLTFESEWWVIAAEYALITHYAPQWNNSGFGSKVPGRGRPGTRTSQWDQLFPPKAKPTP